MARARPNGKSCQINSLISHPAPSGGEEELDAGSLGGGGGAGGHWREEGDWAGGATSDEEEEEEEKISPPALRPRRLFCTKFGVEGNPGSPNNGKLIELKGCHN